MSDLDELIERNRKWLEEIGSLPICPGWTYSAIRHVQRNMDFDVDEGFHEPDRQCGGSIARIVNELPALLDAITTLRDEVYAPDMEPDGNNIRRLKWREKYDRAQALFIAQKRMRETAEAARDEAVQSALKWNTRYEEAQAARDAAIARAEKLEKALGEAREALETARHGLVTTHSLRATDLYRETFDAHVSNGVPVDQLEWTTDNSKGISAIDDLLSRLTTETKP